MGDESNVVIKYESRYDDKGAKAASSDINNVKAGADKTTAGAKELSKNLGVVSSQASTALKTFGGMANEVGGAGKLAGGLASTMGVVVGASTAVGAVVLGIGVAFGVAIAAAHEYADTVKGSTELGNQWGVQADKLEAAYYKVGRVMTGLILPGMEKVADAAEEAANWVEKTGAPGAKKIATTGAQVATIAATGWGNIFEMLGIAKPGTGIEWGKKTGSALGVYDAPEDKAKREAEELAKRNEITRDKLLEYRQLQLQEYEQDIKYRRQIFVANRNFQKQEEYAIFDYQKTRMRGERDFYRQLRYASEDFQKGEYRATRDFYRQEAITIEAFNRQRSIANRDFQINLSRTEYDYQKQRARAQYDHNWSIRMAMLEGDAMAVWQANRQFKIEKQRAEEDYQLQRARSIEDFNRSQADEALAFQIERNNAQIQFAISRADVEQDFQIQRKRSIEQYQIMRKDQEIDFEIQRERAKYQHELTLVDMQYQYNEEVRLRRQMFVESHLPELIMEEETLADVRRQIGEQEIRYWEAILAQMVAGNTAFLAGSAYGTPKSGRGYAEGGYVDRTGFALVHHGEYVLKPSTTSAAEQLARGNRLTQDSILSNMAGASYAITNNFNRGVSPEERVILRHQFEEMVREGFRE